MCVCVCARVCVRERVRERVRGDGKKKEETQSESTVGRQ